MQAGATGCYAGTAPAMGGPMQTCYQYDILEHLISVRMPRNNGTHMRSFNYNLVTSNLTSETQPETGTTQYTYTNDQVQSKTDANGNTTTYTYDVYGRATTITRAPKNYPADPCQSTHYVYDVNPYQDAAISNAWGRLAASYTGDLDASGNPVCTVQAGIAMKQGFTEDYTYTPAGLPSGRGLHMTTIQGQGGSAAVQNWNSTVTYNPEGSPLTVKYPDLVDGQGNTTKNHTVTYTYDGMNRPSTYSSDHLYGAGVGDSNNIIWGVAYNAANQPTQVNYSLYGVASPNFTQYETRSYNTMTQLTSIVSPFGLNLTYTYPVGTNNGQISSMSDVMTNQTVSYTYDALKRLTGATATGSNPWGQSYGYDGFGNLNAKNVTSGSATVWNANIDPATNRVIGYCYDSNGNMLAASGCPLSGYPTQYAFDVQNRLTGSGPGGSVYMYSAQNKRLAVVAPNGNQTIYFYGVTGQKLSTIVLGPLALGQPQLVNNVYFAGRLVEQNNQFVALDRLGSVKPGTTSYLPYGEELSSTPNDTEKFGTYTRDSATGLDYADQRYYSSAFGRFMSADPYKASAGPGDPGSWNRYSYVANDPVNMNDPQGLLAIQVADDSWGGWTGGVYTNSGIFLPYNVAIGPASTSFYRAYDERYATLTGLVQQGGIADWNFVNGNVDQFSLSFQAQTAPIAVGVCVAQPELCAIAAGGASIYVLWPELKGLLAAIQSQITSRDKARVKYDAYKAGRDSDGNCKPPDSDKYVKWQGTGADHWHWIEWNQVKSDPECMTYPKYRSGPNDPGPQYHEIPR